MKKCSVVTKNLAVKSSRKEKGAKNAPEERNWLS
ncbi:hypothetical protein M2254_001051 [Chryseobacterium sp. BIGb0186]|nr:hypothetical protein [Chryseobacterium sp. JUb44]MDH6209467.1 hypothetical protein [Chryseobacterium sp. BIGb0186]